ncbi:mu-type opioid receptor-like [Ptychodera flava]|uniref:mu-type opioid receptor-like n=1 Tax=Ptychodera flava TaxID=63121 RepID=UPI00396A32FE
MALCKPMMYRKGVIHSKRFVVLVIITTWVVSSLISLEGLVDCLFSKTRSVEGRLLYLISVLILLLITTVLYALIIHRVRKSKKAVKKREKQIIRICFSTALVYFLCTMPTVLHAIVMCLYHFDLIAIYWDLVICLMNTSTFLLEINSSVNPILYNALSSIYRKAFKEAFTGPLTEHCSAAYNKLQKRPSHSTELSELNQQKTSERSKPSAE